MPAAFLTGIPNGTLEEIWKNSGTPGEFWNSGRRILEPWKNSGGTLGEFWRNSRRILKKFRKNPLIIWFFFKGSCSELYLW